MSCLESDGFTDGCVRKQLHSPARCCCIKNFSLSEMIKRPCLPHEQFIIAVSVAHHRSNVFEGGLATTPAQCFKDLPVEHIVDAQSILGSKSCYQWGLRLGATDLTQGIGCHGPHFQHGVFQHFSY